MKNYKQISELLFSIAGQIEELAGEIKSMKCPTETVEPEILKRYVINSHNEGDTLAVGDLISWVDNGSLTNPNDTVDVFINGIDQGLSTDIGSYTLTNVPEGDIEVCLVEILKDTNGEVMGTGEQCCYNFIGEESEIDLLKSIDFNVPDTGLMTEQDWKDIFGADYWFDPSNPNYGQIINNQLVFLHPADVVKTQAGGCRVEETGKNKFSLCQEITFDQNFDHGQGPGSSLGGKLGFGIGHTATASHTETNGTVRPAGSIVSGGSTNPTGWLLRPAFRDNELTVYAYFENRNGISGIYGEDIYTGVNWVNGQTYKFEIVPTMNTAGNADGLIEVFIDGNLVATRTGVRFSTTVLDIDVITFSSFHGGSTSPFAPANDTYLTYDNVQLNCIS